MEGSWKQSTKRRVWKEAEQVRRDWLHSFEPPRSRKSGLVLAFRWRDDHLTNDGHVCLLFGVLSGNEKRHRAAAGWNVGVVLLDSYSKRVCSLGQEKWRGPECEVSLQRHRFPGSELARLHDLDRR
jgi:hypothetical protein